MRGLWLATLPLLLSGLLTLAAFGLGMTLDWPRFGLSSGLLLLMCLWLSSVVMLVSTLVDHPAAALTVSYGGLLFLWLLDSISGTTTPWHWLALLPHMEPGFRGLLRSQDLIFFLATGAAALLLAIYRIARRRGEI